MNNNFPGRIAVMGGGSWAMLVWKKDLGPILKRSCSICSQIDVPDSAQLRTVMRRLEQISGVMRVTRPAG